MQDGDFSWSVIPTRGMNLWKAQLADWSVGWNSQSKVQFILTMFPSTSPADSAGLTGSMNYSRGAALKAMGLQNLTRTVG